uniref:Uncharacterized protein n=1 Tax=Glossina austeni TaxID=7395 RepID=A0A1A9V2G1_GLOAU
MTTINITPNRVIELRTKTEQTPQQNECGKTFYLLAYLPSGNISISMNSILRLPRSEWMIIYLSGEGDDDSDVIRADARGIIVEMVGGLNLKFYLKTNLKKNSSCHERAYPSHIHTNYSCSLSFSVLKFNNITCYNATGLRFKRSSSMFKFYNENIGLL